MTLTPRGVKPKILPRRIWIPLLMLRELGKVVTSIRLQKLVFLIQVECRFRDEYDFIEYHYGPYSESLRQDIFVASQLGLVRTNVVHGLEHDYYEYELTEDGKAFTESLLKMVDERDVERARAVLRRYGNMDWRELVEYVYREYMKGKDEFRWVAGSLREVYLPIMRSVWESELRRNPGSLGATQVLAVVEYMDHVLGVAEERVEDSVTLGVLASTMKDLTFMLLELTRRLKTGYVTAEVDPEVDELFEFLQDYCSRKGIAKKIGELDFSEFLDEEGMRRLEEAFRAMKPY